MTIDLSELCDVLFPPALLILIADMPQLDSLHIHQKRKSGSIPEEWWKSIVISPEAEQMMRESPIARHRMSKFRVFVHENIGICENHLRGRYDSITIYRVECTSQEVRWINCTNEIQNRNSGSGESTSHCSQSSVDAPAPRLVGIELNPGPPQLSRRRRIDRDSMSHIFSFLNSPDFASAMKVSKNWNTIGQIKSAWPRMHWIHEQPTSFELLHHIINQIHPSWNDPSIQRRVTLSQPHITEIEFEEVVYKKRKVIQKKTRQVNVITKLKESATYKHVTHLTLSHADTTITLTDLADLAQLTWLELNGTKWKDCVSLFSVMKNRLKVVKLQYPVPVALPPSYSSSTTTTTTTTFSLPRRSPPSPSPSPSLELHRLTDLRVLCINFVPHETELVQLVSLEALLLCRSKFVSSSSDTQPIIRVIRYLSVRHRLRVVSGIDDIPTLYRSDASFTNTKQSPPEKYEFHVPTTLSTVTTGSGTGTAGNNNLQYDDDVVVVDPLDAALNLPYDLDLNLDLDPAQLTDISFHPRSEFSLISLESVCIMPLRRLSFSLVLIQPSRLNFSSCGPNTRRIFAQLELLDLRIDIHEAKIAIDAIGLHICMSLKILRLFIYWQGNNDAAPKAPFNLKYCVERIASQLEELTLRLYGDYFEKESLVILESMHNLRRLNLTTYGYGVDFIESALPYTVNLRYLKSIEIGPMIHHSYGLTLTSNMLISFANHKTLRELHHLDWHGIPTTFNLIQKANRALPDLTTEQIAALRDFRLYHHDYANTVHIYRIASAAATGIPTWTLV